ncbi:mind-meld [Carabus blaptoides fortunei]
MSMNKQDIEICFTSVLMFDGKFQRGDVEKYSLQSHSHKPMKIAKCEVERLLREYRQNQELVRNIGAHYYQIIYPVQLRHHEKMGISTREIGAPKVRKARIPPAWLRRRRRELPGYKRTDEGEYTTLQRPMSSFTLFIYTPPPKPSSCDCSDPRSNSLFTVQCSDNDNTAPGNDIDIENPHK